MYMYIYINIYTYIHMSSVLNSPLLVQYWAGNNSIKS